MIETVLLTRPFLSSKEDALLWEQAGFKTVIAPLLKIFFSNTELPYLENYQAVITTSAEAVRALANLTVNREISLWCVGKASYKLAENLGFQNIFTCSSSNEENATNLLATLVQNLNPEKGPLLYLAGEFVHLDLKVELNQYGFEVEKVVVYQAQPYLDSWPIIQSHLRNLTIRGITFYSQRTASLFNDFSCVNNLKVIENCYPLCLSSSIAEIIQPFFVKSPIIASTTGQLIANLEKILQSG